MLYLASRSPRRRLLLRRLRRPFCIVRSRYRETIRRAERPSVNAMRNAVGKAKGAQLPRGASGLVIGADTFLYFRGRIIGKPRTLRAARRLLRLLSGKRHWVYTGLCVMDARTGRWRAGYEKTTVVFRHLAPARIDRLLARMSPLDKAGGYAIQEDRGALIARLDGSRSNVIGLPLELLRQELATLRRRPTEERLRSP